MTTLPSNKRPPEAEFGESSKKAKITPVPLNSDDSDISATFKITAANDKTTVLRYEESQSILPPSRSLLGLRPQGDYHIVEADVGITEYVSQNLQPINGIIKQRFTDFLVYEVGLDGQVVHINSLDLPSMDVHQSNNVHQRASGSHSQITASSHDADTLEVAELEQQGSAEKDEHRSSDVSAHIAWSVLIEDTLKALLSDDVIIQLKKFYSDGPPVVERDGNGEGNSNQSRGSSTNTRGSSQRRNKGHGKGKRLQDETKRTSMIDEYSVLTNFVKSKEVRTQIHTAIRDLFGGKLTSETDTKGPQSDEGFKIKIIWTGETRRRGQGRDRNATHQQYPPYIHFTLQKTNRDTQDALLHISRLLRVNAKELSVAGTKDKRAVTVQRVSLRRGAKLVEDVWRLANGQAGRKSHNEALTERGERGVRIADLRYRKASLELGMLKGNAFLITLRNVQVENSETIDAALDSLKTKGFINYYGMQRFGTASVPTHSIGLALLQSDWHKAVSLILGHRPGEHPDVVAARDAWLIEHDLNKALSLMPRRVVAERCILESYKKQNGETRNAMGAFSTIPRNLRLMYVHAYQSYVWNAIVSERIKVYGCERPVVGDLVFDQNLQEDENSEIYNSEVAKGDHDVLNSDSPSKVRKPWKAPAVKVLGPADLEAYNIFDVIMPLPGKDVAYPGGALGDKYRSFLREDGLDPDNLVRKQKEYSLSGSYRKILHLPKAMSWKTLRYTDPDVPLAQADEDKLLGFEPPVIDENGKFLALQIEMTLGTAAYATMALREITKTETSSHYQTNLTRSSEDQLFRAVVDADVELADSLEDLAEVDLAL